MDQNLNVYTVNIDSIYRKDQDVYIRMIDQCS